MSKEYPGMVVVDGVRYRKDDLERLHPEKVADAVEETVVAEAVFDAVSTAPGAAVAGADANGATVIDTSKSAAGNVPVVVEEGGVVDGTEVSGDTGGSVDENADSGKRSGPRARSTKSK